ncbi:MAG: hypothetical protein EBS89_00960, partial [Proteobacteria bacterium]|nr:hypothetical protein [Pseudomonadota bacterium]
MRSAKDISLLVKAAVQLEKDEALRLERQLQEVGRDAAQGMSRNFTKEFEKQLGVESKVSRHRATAALNSATRLAEIEEKLDDTRKSLQVATVLVTDAEREKTRVMEDSTATVEDQERATRALADANNNLRRIQSDVITLQHRRIKADRDVMRQSEDLKDTLDNQTLSVGQGLLTIGKYVSALRAIAIPAAAVGAIGLGAQIAGAVAAMSKSFLLIPGAVTGAVAGMGAMSVATMGFGDALKDIGDPAKFAEGLQKLSPNAQQAALSIQAIMPALTELKNATQDALFADGATMINQLANEYLPQIKQMMTQIAGAFNQAFRGIFDELMSPDGIATVDRILNNIGQAFQNLAPAARPFTEALLKLSDVGAGLLPEIATAAAHAANSFANFIREASESGKLEQWLRQGLDAVNSFMDGVYELGRMFFALGENGNTTLGGLRDDLKAFADDFDKVANALDKISVGFGKANALIETFKALTKAATQTLEFFYEGFRKVFNMIPLVPDLPSFDDTAKKTGFGLGTFLKPFV